MRQCVVRNLPLTKFDKKNLNIHLGGLMDVVNALVKDVKKALKNIIGSNVFVEKEQWNVVRMKKKFQP
jgi:hypothetical protein